MTARPTGPVAVDAGTREEPRQVRTEEVSPELLTYGLRDLTLTTWTAPCTDSQRTDPSLESPSVESPSPWLRPRFRRLTSAQVPRFTREQALTDCLLALAEGKPRSRAYTRACWTDNPQAFAAKRETAGQGGWRGHNAPPIIPVVSSWQPTSACYQGGRGARSLTPPLPTHPRPGMGWYGPLRGGPTSGQALGHGVGFVLQQPSSRQRMSNSYAYGHGTSEGSADHRGPVAGRSGGGAAQAGGAQGHDAGRVPEGRSVVDRAG